MNGAEKFSESLSPQDLKVAIAAMILYFNTEYTQFLVETGVPLSCISYYLGAADPQAMLELQKLTQSLRKQYLTQNGGVNDFEGLFGESMTGPEIMSSLRVSSNEEFSPDTFLQDRDATACEKLILYSKLN